MIRRRHDRVRRACLTVVLTLPCRFNVGISLVKLARYRQAARYILDAIRLQHADASSNVKSMKSVTSDILWNTLGTTCMQ